MSKGGVSESWRVPCGALVVTADGATGCNGHSGHGQMLVVCEGKRRSWLSLCDIARVRHSGGVVVVQQWCGSAATGISRSSVNVLAVAVVLWWPLNVLVVVAVS
jgi:hypothetical protein